MSRARVFAAAAAALLNAMTLSAQTSGSALTPVDGLDNWKYTLDLGSYPPGKYNLVVEARDKAGNLTRATPMNIFIDPRADLPIVSIINPTPLLRVGGDLNIVGTCVAAKGVDHVEWSLDGAEFAKADGTEFWSSYLKTAGLPEGRRTLDVRGVDVNGLVGPSARVQFDLDRTKPLAVVDFPPVGSLVAGQIRLSGTVFDANGVRSLDISPDGGKTWTRLDLKKGKDPLRPSFSWSVDTRKVGDGPRVYSLRSVDMVGSTSTAAYILFVDNTKPVIEIARPAQGQAVHGRFSVVGAVRHAVGVKRLSYEFSTGEKGEIPLTRGDPYFVKELDTGAVKGDTASVTLIAEDPIGNITRLSRSYRIDRKADKPVLKVLGPSAGASLRPGEPVWGSISSSAAVAAFRWSLDGSAPVQATSTEAFSFVPPDAASGKHVLSLVPVDVDGHVGDATVFPFVLDKGPGAVTFDHITSARTSRDFSQGAEVRVDAGEFSRRRRLLAQPADLGGLFLCGRAAQADRAREGRRRLLGVQASPGPLPPVRVCAGHRAGQGQRRATASRARPSCTSPTTRWRGRRRGSVSPTPAWVPTAGSSSAAPLTSARPLRSRGLSTAAISPACVSTRPPTWCPPASRDGS